MAFDTWLAYCLVSVVLCLTPGPAVMFVVSVAMVRGAWSGISGALGVLTANAVYFAVSATGVAAVIVTSHRLFTALEWAGAAYLVWMGARMLFAGRRESAVAQPARVPRSFLRGLVVQLANPKSLVFFVALLPQFVDPDRPVALQVAILGATDVAIELAVLAAYAALADRARRAAGNRWSTSLERIGGGLLVAAGARIALTRQL